MQVQQERHQPIPPHNLSMDRIPRPPMYSAPVNSNLPPGQVLRPDQSLQGHSTVDSNGRRYSLEVVQQPVRARMCGFGDKDRRPITPPPCIRLIVTDSSTGQQLDINEIDTTFYVLSVDLWSADGAKEVNLVRHSATSPSISATTSSSYPPPPTAPQQFAFGAPVGHMHGGLPGYGLAPPYGYPRPGEHPQAAYHHPAYSGAPPPPPQQAAAAGGGGATESPQSHYPAAVGLAAQPGHYYPGGGPPGGGGGGSGPGGPSPQLLSPTHAGMPPTQDPRSAPSGMFTRNLIGSLCVSAFKLTDPEGAMGIWFILQDLSVRTEGNFRLKMNFVNVGKPGTPPGSAMTTLHHGASPILASCFSSVLQVFSAKKFPGVIESTQLSKCFATQGIKIPIRKDGPGRREDEDE